MLTCVDHDMGESAAHRSMKSVVRADLEREHYSVVEEPLSPPGSKVSWKSYRPDLLGYKSERGLEQLVLVECETRPNMRRFLSKNHGSVWFQPILCNEGVVRKILAVPRGKLKRIDMKLREEWEIWIIGSTGPMEKVRTIGDERTK